MSDQSESPTIEEIQADFIRAVREGDRVTVSKVNAIGGWDSSHFNARGIQVYADELDRLRAENERLREGLEKIKNQFGGFVGGHMAETIASATLAKEAGE